MKISYNWLRDYLDFSAGPEETAHILTFCGLEVEGIEPISVIEGNLEGVIVGEVLSCTKHPDADRLTLCQVDYGEGQVQIVCGAPNVAKGQKVAVATVGTRLFPGGKELLIRKSKIRGQESEGMICAEDELGLGNSHDGIMVLNNDVAIGTPAAEYFGLKPDYVLEIGLTPNRSDAASHIGTARDLAAYFNISPNPGNNSVLKYPYPDNFQADDRSLPVEVEVEDTKLCPRYTGITISGVSVGPSPAWIQDRLKAVGIRPLNNVVDITNYVLMELGHPLHAFDADMIGGRKVVVRCEPEGTPFVTLDGIERKLSSGDLMICDAVGGMCIAGVFGGEKSGVTESTRNIFLESAYFNPASIRKTARRHGLNTDASFRFERGADPEITVKALIRCAQLIKEVCGGRISSDIVDIYPSPIPRTELPLRKDSLKRMAGIELDPEIAERILASLEFEILERSESGWRLRVPSFKVDVSREADVMEEILRIYGYNNIPLPANISFPAETKYYGDEETLRNQISDALAARGFSEAMNNSLTSAAYAGLGIYDPGKTVRMMNALSSELDAMRQSLLPGLLETVLRNINRQSKDIRMFEFGVTYQQAAHEGSVTGRFDERRILALVMTGMSLPENWKIPSKPVDLFDARHEAEMMLATVGVPYKTGESNPEHPFLLELLAYQHAGEEFGCCGRVSPKVLKAFSIDQDVFYAEFDFDRISRLSTERKIEFKPLQRYPEVRRDLALVLDKSCRFSLLEETALKAGKPFLKEVNLFDVYEGENIGKGKVSYAMSFILQDEQSTLTDKQIEQNMEKILRSLETEHGARLRQ